MYDYILINNTKIEYQIFRMERKTLAIHIEKDGKIFVKAPKHTAEKRIMEFVYSKKNWIFEHYQRQLRLADNRIELSDGATIPFKGGEITIGNAQNAKKWLIKEARAEITNKVQYFSEIMGVTYNRIAIREQKTRWGSCSAKANLNFNWKLIMMPEYILDYVVIHELAHLIEMNHSRQFWNQVQKVCSSYKECKIWLKINGAKY